LWLALLEAARPAGERLPAWGWAGLLLGLVGVAVLCADKLDPQRALRDPGALLALGSAFSWAVGSSIHRHRRSDAPQLTVAAYQMFLGGLGQAMIGAASGEVAELRAEDFTPTAVYAFFHLLVFGSLVGFVAYNWLLGNVSAALTGTYAYVNPMVALVAGWLIGGEPLTARVLGGMAIILAGVAFVRAAGRPTRVEIESSPTESDLVEMACCAEEKV
jgi:drug/metabolite transporter (DMT)-like permease